MNRAPGTYRAVGGMIHRSGGMLPGAAVRCATTARPAPVTATTAAQARGRLTRVPTTGTPRAPRRGSRAPGGPTAARRAPRLPAHMHDRQRW
jgi:hypothetical protein